MHINLKNITLSFEHKTCFENFSTTIEYGSHIAITGNNGAGKSSLLKIIVDELKKTGYKNFSYIAQIIDDFSHLSGGQRFNHALSGALTITPNILLLDEPTNHLDQKNRKSLIRMLKTFVGTLIIVTHDEDILNEVVDTFWHIDNATIRMHKGMYRDLANQLSQQRLSVELELKELEKAKNNMHNKLMREQERAAKSRSQGKKNKDSNKWPTIIGKNKALKGQETAAKKQTAIVSQKEDLNKKLDLYRLPEIIKPRFSLSPNDATQYTVVSIANGSVAYGANIVIENINLSLNNKSKLSIEGVNGNGKSTLVKAILGAANIIKSGDWYIPRRTDIGYLDQQYDNLIKDKTVYENIVFIKPLWSRDEIRRHLNDFLFRKNEEVNTLIANLSGGEMVRLSLCCISATRPKLLILDEVTNNVDNITKSHIIGVIKDCPGAVILISHDQDFISKVGVDDIYRL